MSKNPHALDRGVVILLCLTGLAATLLVWMGGSPQYGILSTVWQSVDVDVLLAGSFVAFAVAALILRRMYRAGSAHHRGLVVFGALSALPLVLLIPLLVARSIHGD